MSGGFSKEELLSDGGQFALRGSADTVAAGYLDNYWVAGHDKEIVSSKCNAISSVLRSRGVVVHELSSSSSSGNFIGLEFGPEGKGSRNSTRSSRLWRLRGRSRQFYVVAPFRERHFRF